jgi:hypothetical protein
LYTTIQIKKDTFERLKAHKQVFRESYDGVLNGILDEVESTPLTTEEINDLKISLDQLSQGKKDK